jgi:4-amino-4-deoxy-L-arabinose transferase-like glycosyltransferase
MQAPMAAEAADTPDLLDRLARGWRAYLIIAVLALAGGLAGVFRMPVMDRDEARYAQATVQMLETGDFVRINLQDEPRNKKPIGIHWLQAASVSLFSKVERREIWAFRLPSVIAAIVAACATLWAGQALLSPRAAFLGAALFAPGMLLGFEAMTAKTDAALCAATTVAMAALARLFMRPAEPLRPKPERAAPITAFDEVRNGLKDYFQAPRPAGWGDVLVFYAALGVGVLIKGPITPLIVGLAIGALVLWERRARWAAALTWWPGPALLVVIALPWLVAIAIVTQGAFFADAIGNDLAPKLAGGDEGHGSPPGYHLVLLPFLIFPATLALPAAGRLIWGAAQTARTEPEAAGPRFLAAWAVPMFVLFELLPTKLPHYGLPLYPAIALLGGGGLWWAERLRWRLTWGAGLVLFAIAGAGFLAIASYGATFMPGDRGADIRRAVQTALLGAMLGVPALAALSLVRSRIVQLAVAAALAISASWAIRERIVPDARDLLITDAAARALGRAHLNPRLSRTEGVLWFVGIGEASLVFETATDARIAGAGEAALASEPGDTIVVEQRAYDEVAETLRRRGLMLETAAPTIAGRNYANGDPVVLSITRVARSDET